MRQKTAHTLGCARKKSYSLPPPSSRSRDVVHDLHMTHMRGRYLDDRIAVRRHVVNNHPLVDRLGIRAVQRVKDEPDGEPLDVVPVDNCLAAEVSEDTHSFDFDGLKRPGLR